MTAGDQGGEKDEERTGREKHPDDLLVSGDYLVTCNSSGEIIPRGAVLIRDGRIAAAGPAEALDREYPQARRMDAGGVIMPGLICGHMHLYSTMARGMALKDEAPANFVQILERLWWRLDRSLDEEDIRYSALVTLMACIRHGTTTLIDHHASPGHIDGSLDILAGAVRQAGLRASLCYEVSDRGGHEEARAGIEENVRFLKRCRREDDPFLGASFGLHASFTLSDETIGRCVEEAAGLDSGFHLHVAEDAADVRDAREKYGKSAVRRLADMGVLGGKTLAIHCVHVDADDIELLRETGTKVIHNPQSNCNNGVGVAPVLELMARGIPVGLGSDGFTANMFDEIRTANIIHKLDRRDPRVAYTEVPGMIFKNNRLIAGLFFDQPLGVIEPGAAADIIALDYDPATPLNAGSLWGHVLFGLAGARVSTTIVGGRVLMHQGELLDLDEAEICARSRQLAEKLWDRF
jgi:putative selenium metabolism protein SsnA